MDIYGHPRRSMVPVKAGYNEVQLPSAGRTHVVINVVIFIVIRDRECGCGCDANMAHLHVFQVEHLSE